MPYKSEVFDVFILLYNKNLPIPESKTSKFNYKKLKFFIVESFTKFTIRLQVIYHSNSFVRYSGIMNENKHTSSIIQTTKNRRVRRPGSKKQRNTVIFVILVLVAAVAAAYIIFSPKEQTYELRTYTSEPVQQSTIQDTLEISGIVNVRFQTNILATESGVLESVLASEGDWVEENQIVAVIDAENLETSLLSSQQQLVTQTRNYERFLLHHEQDLLGVAQQRNVLQTAVTEAEEQLAETAQLYKLGSATLQSLEAAEEHLIDTQSSLEKFTSEQLIDQQLFELDNLDYQDNLLSIRETIADLEEQLENTNIRTPIKGQVVSVINELAIGRSISVSTSIMEIADTDQPLIEAEIEEQYVSYISVGHPVVVSVSGQYIPGSIEKIGLSAQAPSGGGTPTVSLEIAVEPEDQLILIGSSALVEFVLQEIENALVLPRGPYLTTGNRQYLFKIEDNEAQRIEITVGSVTETQVEILTGVSAGDEIITSSYLQYIDYEKVTLGEIDD